jgi:mono/diheme cytochrome c family protein
MLRRTTLFAVALAALLAALAVQSRSEPTANPDTPDSATAQATAQATAPATADASPDSVAAATLIRVSGLFAEHCSRCHGEKRPAAGLGLSSGADLAALVHVAAAGNDTLMLVVAGHPESSYLMMKVKGTDVIMGNRMPIGAKPLSDEEVGIISEWISGLAAPDTTAHPVAAEVDSTDS